MENTDRPNQYRSFTGEQLDARYNATLDLILPMEADSVTDWYLREAKADSGLWEDLCGAFQKLTQTDPDHARAIFVNLAQRKDPEERWLGAFHIIQLTPIDHDAGMHFWENFMRDPDERVREFAFNTLEERVSAPTLEGQNNESFQELGITWQDACNLYRAYLTQEESGLYPGLGVSAAAPSVDQATGKQ